MSDRRRVGIPVTSEAVEQTHLFRWAAMQKGVYPELNYLFAIPNGGSRNKAEAARLKEQGVKAGVPDMFLPVANGKYHGLWIELKRQQGGRLAPEQQAWLDALTDNGFKAVRCNGFDEARMCILGYLKGEL